MLFDQILAAFLELCEQGVQRFIALQRAQILGIGRRDVDGDVVGMRIHAFQADQVVVDRIFDGGDGVFANVQAQDAPVLTETGPLDVGQEGVKTFVVEAQAIDECVGLGQAEHAGLGIAGLGLGRDRAHFHKAETHGAQTIDDAAVLIEPSGHAHPIGEGDARDFDRVAHPFGAPKASQRGVLKPG